MKKLKIGLIAIALLIGGVQAYGGRYSQTYYCLAGTGLDASSFQVAATSPAFSCFGGQVAPYVCTFSAANGLPNGYNVIAAQANILTTYSN
ncbi:hypothetical protein ACQKLP_05415 [Chitinophaga sp. NPDC101104]|uniref:hypothetical protein n=1 Tax=Chitinophaga sp. NPDC101104 TaxID=3390561 RepID=UPI003D08DE7C